MKLNWLSYYMPNDGYGRFSAYCIKALRRLGHTVKMATMVHVEMPRWLQVQDGFDTNNLTISCLPPYLLAPVPGRHWFYSMTEGSLLPPSWVDTINAAGVERVIVPCPHNALAFINSGVEAPIYVVPGGTDPEDFPLSSHPLHPHYTFLAVADRGFRKGWEETREAFYGAFGGKTTGQQDVRLIIKCRPREDNYIQMMANAEGADPRITFQETDVDDMRGIYAQADCVVIPSRSEGWGMLPREAACMGLPVITQRYSGLDDGFTQEWALVLRSGRLRPIPVEDKYALGEWMIADQLSLIERMSWCQRHPVEAKRFGNQAALWLRENQTWEHAVQKIIELA